MTTESFLRRLKKWEHAGFIHSDVWSHMNDILDSDARTSIEVGASISTPDEFEKLTEDDMITNRVVSCVSRFIVTSRMLQFALEILRLEFNQLMEAEYDFQQDKMRSNIEVCHQCNVFSLSLLYCYSDIIFSVFDQEVKYLIVKQKYHIFCLMYQFHCLFKVFYLSPDNDALV